MLNDIVHFRSETTHMQVQELKIPFIWSAIVDL
jgi:hypothetical protein